MNSLLRWKSKCIFYAVSVVSSMKEYEDKAVALAQNPSKLEALANKLKEARMTCPLFDTRRWVSSYSRWVAVGSNIVSIIEQIFMRIILPQVAPPLARLSSTCFVELTWYWWSFQVQNLERAYFRMWNLHCSGQHPQPFKVTENDSEFPYDR